ncbi:arylformamidase [Nitrospirillum iridis]|uniref:Kynurenine formamidase n=1 Tax=Nitrospirillum iridis TaxID=765888 RepID=A0A7X0B478_9PROT|nr:arylformamidase [Nitrospirillum iridis]MBB6255438.1 arylformamidase [Nitrospirillum iridis]
MTLWDITQAVRPGIPVWPGDTAYQEERVWTLGPGCPVNVSRLTLSTHTGTHADAPLHYDAAGLPIGAVDLVPYLGPCRLIDVTAGQGPVEPEELSGRLDDAPPRILLRTYRHFPHDSWITAFRAIDCATIERLAAAGARLIGVDAPSLDPEESKDLRAHDAVRRNVMAILEGLVLDAVPEGDYELIALPLKLAQADAAPVRAILRALPMATRAGA